VLGTTGVWVQALLYRTSKAAPVVSLRIVLPLAAHYISR